MKIGILDTGPIHDALQKHGDYPSMFRRLLDGCGFDFETYRVKDMNFPASATACDGWLITGSRHGAYEDHPFIAPLEQLIRDAFAAGHPVVGICFGHQIMAQALGGTVEKFAGGWAVGATPYEFDGEPVMLNAWHQDQVTQLPPGAEVISSSPFCRYAGLVYGDKGLSVQAHPEFDRDLVGDLIAVRGRGVVPDPLLETATARLDTPIDSAAIARRIASFFTDNAPA